MPDRALSPYDKLRRVAQREHIAWLWDEGFNAREIAEMVGRSLQHVRTYRGYVAPPEQPCEWCGSMMAMADKRQRFSDNCRKRQDEDSKRGVCSDCGESLSAGSGYEKPAGPVRCYDCMVAARWQAHRERDLQIEAWWLDGLPLREIADRLGWTVNHLGIEMARLREAGYDLPYRYSPSRRPGGPRFPEQVR